MEVLLRHLQADAPTVTPYQTCWAVEGHLQGSEFPIPKVAIRGSQQRWMLIRSSRYQLRIDILNLRRQKINISEKSLR